MIHGRDDFTKSFSLGCWPISRDFTTTTTTSRDHEIGKSRARRRIEAERGSLVSAARSPFHQEDAGRRNCELINWLSEGNPLPSVRSEFLCLRCSTGIPKYFLVVHVLD